MDFPKKQAQRLMPLYLLEYSEKLFENHPDPEAPWGGGGGSPIEAGTGIDITGDETKTISIDETVVATKTDIASMVTTTMLEDALDDYALKTDIPENVSDLNNDAGYITSNALSDYVTSASLTSTLSDYAKLNDDKQNITANNITVTPGEGYIHTTYGSSSISMSIPRTPGYTLNIPTKDGTLAVTSDIPDVSEFVTETTLTNTLADYELKSEAFSGDYDDLTNKPDLSIYAESADLATVATSGSYNDLIDKPTIPSIPVTDVEVNGVSVLSGTVAEVTVPTDTSDLTNSAGFITSSAIPTNVSSFTNDANYVTSASLTAELANYVPSSSITTVAYTGSYNDLTDTPTIGHGVLTIQVNGVNVKQFSANETAAKTANIIVPTKTSDLTNDSGFITSSAIANDIEYIDLGSGSYTPVITQTILDKIATNPKKYVLLYNFTYQGATYCIRFQYMNTVAGSYFYQSYNVGKVVNNTLTECSMVFTMAIRISDGVPTMTNADTTPEAGTGIRITGNSISVDPLTVAMKSDLPTVNDPTITFTQGGVTKGSITLNQSSNQTIALDAAGSSYSAGTGIDITNNEISIDNTVALKSELFSGDYNDLTNKPTIPTVNDNTITITQGGVTKGSFTLNQNTNQTIEVDDVPGMIGEVIFNVTPTTGTTTYNINLSKDITQYSYIEVYYNDNDDTIRRFCSKFQEPAVGNKITLTSHLNNSTPRLYTKDTVFTIATTTSLTLDSNVQQRISNNAATTVNYSTTEMNCRPYKIIGYKQNSAPIVIPDFEYHNGDTYENRNYYQLYGYATNGGKDLQFTVTFNKSLANISSVTVNKIAIVSRGINGYVGSNSYIDYAADTTNYTVSTVISSDNAITITVRANTAWSNVTNNTPVCAVVQNVAGALKLTFNS